MLVSGPHPDQQYNSGTSTHAGQLLTIWDCPRDSGTVGAAGNIYGVTNFGYFHGLPGWQEYFHQQK